MSFDPKCAWVGGWVGLGPTLVVSVVRVGAVEVGWDGMGWDGLGSC